MPAAARGGHRSAGKDQSDRSAAPPQGKGQNTGQQRADQSQEGRRGRNEMRRKTKVDGDHRAERGAEAETPSNPGSANGIARHALQSRARHSQGRSNLQGKYGPGQAQLGDDGGRQIGVVGPQAVPNLREGQPHPPGQERDCKHRREQQQENYDDHPIPMHRPHA